MNAVPLDELLAVIRGHLAAGDKIAAIKAYREATGAGLAEAKDAVELIEAGKAALPRVAAQPEGEAGRRMAELIVAGDTLESIKLCREATGLGLKEAKAVVDTMAAELKRGGATRAIPRSAAVERPRVSSTRLIPVVLALVVFAAAIVALLLA